jgi:Zn-dependent protease
MGAGLTFRIGSIPVRVQFIFLITMIFFARSTNPGVVAVWAGVVFVSILVHELGHALMGRAFGLTPQIEIHGMGGTTSWTDGRKLTPGRSILVSLAGPAVGIVIGFAVLVAVRFVGEPAAPLAREAVEDVIWVNLVWGIFNLLPMLPLDGGNVMAAVFALISGGRGRRAAHFVSLGVAGLVGAGALYTHQVWVAVLAGLFAFQNVRGLQAEKALDAEGPLRENLAEGFLAIDRGEGNRAIQIAEQVVQNAATAEVRNGGLKLLAYGRLLEGHWGSLMSLLEATRTELGAGELTRFEQAARELDRPEEAEKIRGWIASAAGFQR